MSIVLERSALNKSSRTYNVLILISASILTSLTLLSNISWEKSSES